MPAPRIVNCPRCGAPVAWLPQNRHRPFCSERCKLIDFGAWASESYRVPFEQQDEERAAPGASGQEQE